jgi:AcrR family transcriptional regulator
VPPFIKSIRHEKEKGTVTSQPIVVEVETEVAESQPGGAGRPMRADARRNYERLVTAAKEVFAAEGEGASMESIARHAGVGVGTLYRHFPKRIDVVEAVYRTDVDELVQAAEDAVETLAPWPAVVAFLEAFTRYAQSKRTLLNELRDAFDKNADLKLQSRERIDRAADLVIGRAQGAGVVRTDVDGSDVIQLVAPMCTSPTLTAQQSARLLPLILDGLRLPSGVPVQ